MAAPSFKSGTAWLLVTVASISLGVVLVTETEPKDSGVPVPLRVTLCGLPAALSLIASVPIHAPPIVGVKVTEIEQFFPAARLTPQLVVGHCEVTTVVMPVMLSEAFPLLLNLTELAALVVPTD